VDPLIRPGLKQDAGKISEIYNHYVLNTCFTFDEEETDQEDILQRMSSGYWLVYEVDGKVVGYTYATTWKDRSAYRFTLESSVYVHQDYHGKGIASKLYEALFKDLLARDIHSVMATIALPNRDSVHFHEKMGFQKVGVAREVGYKFNLWVDVGYWQKMLD